MFLYNRTLQLLKNKLIFNHFDYQRQQFYSIMSTKKALVILTEGAEEMELVITADVLRRAQVCFSMNFRIYLNQLLSD